MHFTFGLLLAIPTTSYWSAARRRGKGGHSCLQHRLSWP
ncbi:MAG: hypothetical protein ACREX9_04640 [Gammaproteobacteria bacterium]